MGGPCALFGLDGRPASHPRKTLSRLAAAIVRSRASQLERSQWGRPFWLSREIFARAGLAKPFALAARQWRARRIRPRTRLQKCASTGEPLARRSWKPWASIPLVVDPVALSTTGRSAAPISGRPAYRKNPGTSVLVERGRYGMLKTRIAEDWAMRRGFQVRRVYRRLDANLFRTPIEPGIALAGLDRMPARRL